MHTPIAIIQLIWKSVGGGGLFLEFKFVLGSPFGGAAAVVVVEVGTGRITAHGGHQRQLTIWGLISRNGRNNNSIIRLSRHSLSLFIPATCVHFAVFN